MNKETKKTAPKKGKNSEKKSNKKKINKTALIIILCCLVVGLGTGLTVSLSIKKEKAKNLDVAFYKLSDLIKSEIEKYVSQTYSGKITFTDISEEQFDARKIARKYDLFFSWNGSAVSKLDKYAEPLPEGITSQMPTSLRKKANKALPIILDHYEFDYYRKAMKDAELNFPQNIVELEEYLKKMRSYTFTPFFCAGGNDDTLLALVGGFVEAFGGAPSYNELINNFIKRPSLAQTMDFELSTSGKKQDSFTLRAILDMFRNWQEEGLVHPNWYRGTQVDVEAFMDVKQIAILFTPLSVHRTMPYKNVSEMDVDRMPVFSFNTAHGVIAPSVVGLKLTDQNIFDDALYIFTDDSTQEALCMKIHLGPVNRNSRVYDRQSSDVRFIVAACSEGALPPLGDAVFQTNEAAKHKIAEEIRNYLKNGPTGVYKVTAK